MKAGKTIDIGFANVEIYEHYIISTINEGVTFGETHLSTLFDIFALHYGDRPFISIANRAHDYTIDPTMFKRDKYPSLLAIGVVCHTEASKEIAKFERTFYDGTFEIFDTIEDAKSWAAETLQAH